MNSSETPLVAIAEGNNATESLNNGLNLLGGLSKFLSKEDNVLILIDLQCPFTCPSSINQETLNALLSNIYSIGVSKIQVLPGVMWGIDQKKALKLLGLEELLQNFGAISITYEELYKFSAPIMDEITKIICISQIRTEPLWKLTSSSYLIWFLNSPKKRWKNILNNRENYNDERIKYIFDFLDKKIPTLYINDSYFLLTGNGPFAWNTTKSIKIQKIFLSKNIFALDWITFEHFGLDPNINPLLKSAFDRNLIEKELFTINSEVKSEIPIIKFPELNLNKIHLEGLTLYLGELSNSEKYILYQFIFMIRDILLKDSSNFGNWAIFAGNNPPDPDICCDIIVFGDNAIKSTKNHKFRTIAHKTSEMINLMGFEFGVGEILEGDELEKAILIQQRKIRQKVEKTRKKYGNLIETLNNLAETSDEDVKREKEETKRKYQMKMEIKINKFQYQIEKLRINIIAKHKIQSIRSKLLNLTLNERVIDVPGNPPLGWDSLIYLSHFWKNKQIPTLNLFIRISSEFYAYPSFNKNKVNAKLRKLKKQLKKREKEKNKILGSKNKSELKKIESETKKELKTLNKNYKKNTKRIKKKYTLIGETHG
ncbi:MAG: hypothetical protein ACTSWX_07335 [Promethearchaeota archaeon]